MRGSPADGWRLYGGSTKGKKEKKKEKKKKIALKYFDFLF